MEEKIGKNIWKSNMNVVGGPPPYITTAEQQAS